MSKFLGVPVKKGEIVRERVRIATYADGTPVQLPVMTIGGVKDGPTLYMQAGIHGDEMTGVEVLRRAIRHIDPATVAGTVVVVPICNPPAYLTRSREYVNEERHTDVFDVFPGAARGLLSERIAHALLSEFITNAEFSIDFHSALDGCEIVPFCYVWPNDNEHGSLAFRESQATAFGTDYVYYHDAVSKFGTSVGGGLSVDADAAGGPLMLAEMGESRRVSRQFVDIGVRGVRNVMINMGMLEGEVERNPRQRTFTKFTLAHADEGGALELAVELGDDVVEGQRLADIYDVFGDKIDEVVAPCDGFVQRLMRLGSVNTGAEIAWIGS
jgi:uncharacterized protein